MARGRGWRRFNSVRTERGNLGGVRVRVTESGVFCIHVLLAEITSICASRKTVIFVLG